VLTPNLTNIQIIKQHYIKREGEAPDTIINNVNLQALINSATVSYMLRLQFTRNKTFYCSHKFDSRLRIYCDN